MLSRVAPLAAALLAAPAAAQDNVLIVIADDLGVEALRAYGEGSDYPDTDVLDLLAEEGVLFRNAYASPVCSPTRASLHTGRYPFRTGIGDIVGWDQVAAFAPDETTLPELLDLGAGAAWTHAAIGKWHLGTDLQGGFLSPNEAGWSHYVGSMNSLSHAPSTGYYDWEKVVNGSATISSLYNTTDTIDEALAWLATASEPWLLYVAFNAPHAPWEAPPPELHEQDLTGLDPAVTPRPFFKAMVEALDAEFGRLLDGLAPEVRARTTVIFLGDNGTPKSVIVGVPPQKAKGTVYEGGVNVPLIVSGPLVATPGSESAALVHVVDVFPTVAEIAGIDLAATLPDVAIDGFSLLPHLADPALPSTHQRVLCERFAPNQPTGDPFPPVWCQLELNAYAGPGTTRLSVCGAPLFDDGVATLAVSGGPPRAPAWIAVALDLAPTPLFGGTLAAWPALALFPIELDADGGAQEPVVGGAGPELYPWRLVLQALVADPTVPKKVQVTNAVIAEFPPEATSARALRDDRFKLVRRLEPIAGAPVESEQLFDLLLDPAEEVDLIEAGLEGEAAAAYAALSTALDALLSSER